MLKGTIIKFDDKYQKGVIQNDNQTGIEKFTFTTISWKTNKSSPAPNMRVRFKVDSKSPRDIIAVAPEDENLPSEEDETIYVTRGRDKCVEAFFGNVISVVSKYIKDDTSEGSSYDFLLIKTFLFTAYNNLVELDPTLGEKSLATLKSDLVKIFKSYSLFKKQTQYTPSFLFYDIFLKRQVQFMRTERLSEEAKQARDAAESKEKSIYSLLQSEEAALSTLQAGTKKYLEKESEVKKLRGLDMKLLDDIDKNQKKRVKYETLMEVFKTEHYPAFEEHFLGFRNNTINSLVNILNKRSYELDKVLWEYAKKSGTIKGFFADSGIVGTFSFKTYLKYFLKNIDEEKANSNMKELMALMDYIDSTSIHNIIIVDSDASKHPHYKQIIKKLDEGLDIIFFKDQSHAASHLMKHTPDVMFVNVYDGDVNSFMRTVQRVTHKNFEKISVIGLVSKQENTVKLEHFKKAGIGKFAVIEKDKNDLENEFRMVL